jgi:integrase
MRKPFYRKERKAWYYKNDAGRFIKLDPDKETAWELWRKMQAPKITEGQLVTARTVIALYLEEFEHRKSEHRFKSIDFPYLMSFANHSCGSKRVIDLKQSDVHKWLNEPKKKVDQWSDQTKLDALNSIKAAFRWARDEGKIVKNPLARIKLAAPPPRREVVTHEQYQKLMRGCGPALRCYMIAARTGARPRQIRELTAENISTDWTVWTFQQHKTRGKTKSALTVFLPPCVQTLSRILVHYRPTGPLLRNSNGDPWKKDTLAQLVRRTRERLKLPRSVIAYAMRHSFATESLLAGATLAETAVLLGHKSTRMVSQVYGHLDQHRQHMLEAAAKASRNRLTS